MNVVRFVQRRPVKVMDFGRLWLEQPRRATGTRRQKQRQRRLLEAKAMLKNAGWLKPYEAWHMETVSTVSVDGYKLMEFVLRMARETRLSGWTEGFVIVGPKQASEFLSTELAILQPVHLDLRRYHFQIRGLQVVVLPWMDGAVLLPREFMPAKTG